MDAIIETKGYFLVLLNSVSKMPLGGWGEGVRQGPRADNVPRAPRNVNPAHVKDMK
jgi:hypothetical protein